MGSKARGRAAALVLGTLVGAVGLPLLAAPAGAVDTRKPTTATIGTSSATSTAGQPVTLTADVHATPPATGSPSASVQFVDGGGSGPVLATVPMTGGVASLTTSSLGAGTHDLIARFAGGTAYQPSDSAPVRVTVAKANTSLSLSSSANPAVAKQPVTYTATVVAVAPGSGTPSSTVSFSDNGVLLGTAPMSGGVATFTTTAATQSLGTHAITATFAGGVNMNPSTGGLSQVVNKASTATTLGANPTAAVSGQGVTLTATVAAVAPSTGTPSATITFKDGATTLGSAATVGGVATLVVSTLAPGAHNLTASFPGGTYFNASTSAAVPVNIGQSATSTALSSSASFVVAGSPVTFSATVTPVAPGGGIPASTVTFRDGATVLGTVALTAGSASLTTSTLTAGSHNITATYNGGAKYLGSTSPTLVQSISATSDTNGPSISLTHPTDVGSWNHGATTVTISSSDAETGLAGLPVCTVNGSPATPAGTPGTATLTFSGDGTSVVSCTATDNAGNPTTAGDVVNIDGTAPTIGISHSPAAFFNNGTVEFTIALADAGSGLSGPNCNASGSPISLTIGGDGVARGSISFSGAGFHQVQCNAGDVAGNGNGGADQTIIDLEAPTVSVDGVTAGATYSTEPTPSCSASDNYGISSGSILSVDPGAAANEVVATCSKATDLAGNVSGTASVSYFVVLDGGAPDIEVSHTANANGWNSDEPVSVTISVSDPLPSSGLSAAPICTVDGNPATVDGSGTPYTVSVGGEGIHDVACEITDDAGNTASASDTVSIDLTDPTVSIDGPTDGAVYSDGTGAPAASCNGIDGGSGVESTQLDVAPTFPTGSYQVTCWVTDLAGRTNNTSLTYGIDDQGPTLTVTHDGDITPGYNNGTSVAFTVMALDAAPTVGFAADATCTDNGNPVSWTTTTGPDTSAVSGDYRTYVVTISDEGSHSIHCEITDGTGRSASADDSVTIDRTAPSASLSAPLVNLSYLSDGDITLTTTDNVGVTSIACDDNFSFPISFTDSGDGQHFTWTPNEGAHSIFCDVSDATGNHQYAALNVTVDRTDPVTSVSSPDDGGIYPTALFPGLACNPYDGGSGVRSSTVSDLTSYGGGYYSATCTVTDWADNTFTSDPVYWTIDDFAPTISLSYPKNGANGWNVDATVPVSVSITDANLTSWDCSVDSSPVSVNAVDTISIGYDGFGIYVTCSAQDAAGNWASEYLYVDHDGTVPDVYLDGPTDGATYLSPADVPTLSCDASDTTSGVYSFGSPSTTQIDSTTWEATCSGASDWAGNVAADVTVTYTVDAPPPDVYIIWSGGNSYGWSNYDEEVYPDVYSHNGWGAGAVCWDGGVYVTAGTAFWLTDDGVHDIECVATDTNGKHGTASATISIDKTAPDVTVDGVVDGGSYPAGSAPNPSCSTTDSLSGVRVYASAMVTGTGDGWFLVECVGEDYAGNSTYASAVYYVAPNSD